MSHSAERASKTELGHVKVGENLTIEEDGTLNAEKGFDPETEYVQIGINANIDNESRNTAVGRDTEVLGANLTALGYGAKATAWQAIALGFRAIAKSTDAIAIGNGAIADSISIGRGAKSTDILSVAIGYGAEANNRLEGVLGGKGMVGLTSWIVPGDFSVNGTKNFEMHHPHPDKKSTHRIRHGAVESPTAGGTIYRYEIGATQDNDVQYIDLPDYFIYLNKDV